MAGFKGGEIGVAEIGSRGSKTNENPDEKKSTPFTDNSMSTAPWGSGRVMHSKVP
jgi:hypothetical protein